MAATPLNVHSFIQACLNLVVVFACSGMNLRTFTQNGSGFFLHRPSEVSQFSMSARAVIHPLCGVVIRDGSRPPLSSSVNQAPASEPVVNGTNVIDTAPHATSPQDRFYDVGLYS